MKELKAQDFRIGNWIYDDEGILCKINGFTPFDHSTRCDELEGCLVLIDIYRPNGDVSKGYECNINEMKPIELTEDLLLRLGYKYFNGKNEGTLTMDFEGKLDIDYHDGEIKVKSHYEGEHMYRKLFNIKYLHQLQNLYFALSGIELTLKD